MIKRILRRGSLLMLPVLVVGGVGFGLASAPVAHAGSTSVTAYFETGGVIVYGSGFTPGTRVRFEALTPTLSRVEAVDYETADSSGRADGFLLVDRCAGPDLWHFYAGKMVIAADGSPGPTAWASGTLASTLVLARRPGAPVLRTGQSLGQVDAPAPAGIQLGEHPISCRGYHGPLTGANGSSLLPNEHGGRDVHAHQRSRAAGAVLSVDGGVPTGLRVMCCRRCPGKRPAPG